MISGQKFEEEVPFTSISNSTACNCLLHCRLNKHYDRRHTGHGSCPELPVVCRAGYLSLQYSSHLSRVLQTKNKRKYKQTNKRFVRQRISHVDSHQTATKTLAGLIQGSFRKKIIRIAQRGTNRRKNVPRHSPLTERMEQVPYSCGEE